MSIDFQLIDDNLIDTSNIKHRGEGGLRNTCGTGIQVNESNKYKYFKEVTVQRKLLNKRLNKNLIHSANSLMQV